MKVAVVILNYNGEKLLPQFLPSVIKHTPYEIYVVDNASTDKSLEILKRDYPAVNVIVLDKNYGFAEGYNRGLQTIEADYFMLLNSDVEVTENWLEPLIDLLDRTPDCAVCQPKLLSFFNKNQFEYAGAAGGELDYLGYPFCRGRMFSTLEMDKGQYNTAEIFWATGAAFMIRSEIYKKFGGFDPLFFAHQEEIDLCFRIRNAGFNIFCVTSSICYHYGGATLKKSSFRKTFLNFRNNHLLLYKNYPKKLYRRIVFVRFVLDVFAAFVFLLTGKPVEFYGVICALFSFLNMKKQYKSLIRNKSKKLPSKIYPHSILKEYHFLKHKMFSQLSENRK
ncbi:MAG: glycosyltransferase family 2 protein [Bacteroidales bacterium]|jgi:GT2 family glycosyltransferase|nr:glycosyltransferase family 2 protein [Bacteroidales bacterium]